MRKTLTYYVVAVLAALTLLFGPDFWVGVWQGLTAGAGKHVGKSVGELTLKEFLLLVLMWAVLPAFILAPIVLVWNIVHGIAVLLRRRRRPWP